MHQINQEMKQRNKISFSVLTGFLCAHLDCGLRQPADGGRVHPAALLGHPREHGSEQP